MEAACQDAYNGIGIDDVRSLLCNGTLLTDMGKKLEDYGLADGVYLTYPYVFGPYYGAPRILDEEVKEEINPEDLAGRIRIQLYNVEQQRVYVFVKNLSITLAEFKAVIYDTHHLRPERQVLSV